mmetsp:Transcript_95552/g.247040  ORF Transcript_95552/g.247040 Transcript_95552/m.247040 type:complete len:272 (-) Transcript_95552:233-1048(-)
MEGVLRAQPTAGAIDPLEPVLAQPLLDIQQGTAPLPVSVHPHDRLPPVGKGEGGRGARSCGPGSGDSCVGPMHGWGLRRPGARIRLRRPGAHIRERGRVLGARDRGREHGFGVALPQRWVGGALGLLGHLGLQHGLRLLNVSGGSVPQAEDEARPGPSPGAHDIGGRPSAFEAAGAGRRGRRRRLTGSYREAAAARGSRRGDGSARRGGRREYRRPRSVSSGLIENSGRSPLRPFDATFAQNLKLRCTPHLARVDHGLRNMFTKFGLALLC